MMDTKIFKWVLFKSILLISFLVLTTSCLSNGNIDSTESTNMNTEFFTIHIFDIRNSVLPDSIDFQSRNSWRELLTIDLNQSDFVINEKDIKFYDWSSQKITLENDAGKRYAAAQPQPPGFSYFVIAVKGVPVSGGGILSQNSAVFANFPILYVPDPINSEPFELFLRSTANIIDSNPLFPVAEPSTADEVRKHFRELNKLIE